jgi:hypothetical protein
MAHYAFLDENNVVTEVITGVDETELIEGLDPETWYGNFKGQACKRTSYNTIAGEHTNGGVQFRKNFAGIGYTYNSALDAFIAPKEQEFWELNTERCIWEPRTPKPQDGRAYDWNQESYSWVLRD